jgi:hypothetical protein
MNSKDPFPDKAGKQEYTDAFLKGNQARRDKANTGYHNPHKEGTAAHAGYWAGWDSARPAMMKSTLVINPNLNNENI